jgi:hypothetical protein
VSARPLQNRVDPFGELVVTPARGVLFGNRGGRFHRDDQTLGRRRWATKQWIACVLQFKGRRRAVWGAGYTELFFADEVTALAAGHRPCFECRRAEAEAFRGFFCANAWVSAPEMDAILHRERLDAGRKRLWESAFERLPDGTMIALMALRTRCAATRFCPGASRAMARLAGGLGSGPSR